MNIDEIERGLAKALETRTLQWNDAARALNEAREELKDWQTLADLRQRLAVVTQRLGVRP